MYDTFMRAGNEEDANECLDAIKLAGIDFAKIQEKMGIIRQDGSRVGRGPSNESRLDDHGHTHHVDCMPVPYKTNNSKQYVENGTWSA